MSNPAVTQIETIVFNPKKIRRGDLFVAVDPSQISEAVAAGAYAVLYEGNVDVSDTEIAWLKTDSIEYALLRLLRFHLLEKSLNAVSCDAITLAVAAQMMTDERCYVLEGSVTNAFDDLWQLAEGSWVFVGDEAKWEDLFVNVLPLPREASLRADIAEQTLFETSFVLDGVFYDRMPLSPFFLPYLAPLYAFAKAKALDFRVCGMQGSEHFVPVFVSDDLQVKTFGQGGKVLVFEPDISLLLREIEFIRSEAKWARIVYLVPQSLRLNIPANVNVLPYDSQEDIMHLLKTTAFHFALVGGQDKSFLEHATMRNAAPTLF